jgi:outer membrane cobalamin receptor
MWLALLLLTPANTPPALKQEIVVTAAREEQPRDQAAAAVTVLDRAAIERLPASSLAELLGYVPGITMMFDSGASGVPTLTSRGFFGGGEVEYVKLLIDGVPVGDAESGNVDWQRLRASDIERIEVLHGPGSALYGDTALGGVIQVFTRDDDGEAHVTAGTFGARDLGASFGTELGSGFRLHARAGGWQTSGFRQHAGADDRLLQLALERLGDRSRWRIEAAGDREHRQTPGELTPAEIAADRAQSNPLFRFDHHTATRTRLAATYDSFGAAPLRAALYGMHRDDDNLRSLLLAPGFATSALRSLSTRTGGGTFEASREWARVTLRAGADLERASLRGTYASVDRNGSALGTVASEDGTRDRAGVFVTGGWTLADRWRFSAGLRRDAIRDDVFARRTSSAWSPRAGVNVHAGGVALFAQVSTAFKAPTLDQLFDPRPYPDGRGGTFTISNPQLRPQRAHNLELGASRATAWSEWSVTGYRMKVRDEIDFDPRTFSYDNIGSSLHRGIEASGAIARSWWLSPQVTYAWTRVADAATPERQLKNIPEHAAQLLLHARLGAATRADVIYRWRGGLSLDDAGTFRTPGVSRVDLRVARDFNALRVEADLLNALDAQSNELGYVLFDFRGRPTPMQWPAPGRALRLGVTWRFRGTT